MVALFLLAFMIVMGIASLLGWTVDTRDPEFSLGRIIEPHPNSTPPSV